MLLLSGARARAAMLAAVAAACSASTGCADRSRALVVDGHDQPPGQTVATLAFDDPGALALAPGATQTIGVTATPAGVYSIAFSLLGEPGDGSLDQATVSTSADGTAQVTLRAPSIATTFAVRAALLGGDGAPTGAFAQRSVSVSQQGFGTVEVIPSYLGHRTVTTWVADVSTGSCAALRAQGAVPDDAPGGISATASLGSDPLVHPAPVGVGLAVALRAGHFAWGCTDTTTVTANSTVPVTVSVLDKPIDLAAATLDATFTYAPDPSSYATVLAEGVSTLVDAFMPTTSSEGTIVLNSMAAAATDPATFAEVRVQAGWDAIADAHFTMLSKGLRETCSDWATTGAAAQPTTVQASLVGQTAGPVAITVTQFGSLDATTAGVSALPDATWSGQPNDGVLLSGALVWQVSRFVGASSIAPAQAAQPSASTVSDALTLAADCDGLAAALGSFGTCDVACVSNLCGAAIGARWTAALGASSKAAAVDQLFIQASASANVGDVAQPVSLAGEWQGRIVWGPTQMQLALQGGVLTAN